MQTTPRELALAKELLTLIEDTQNDIAFQFAGHRNVGLGLMTIKLQDLHALITRRHELTELSDNEDNQVSRPQRRKPRRIPVMSEPATASNATVAKHVAAIDAKVGFGFEMIISLLLPLLSGWLAKCNRGDPEPQTAKEAILLNYDQDSDTFDDSFIVAGRKRSRLAVLKAHRKDKSKPRRLPTDKLDEITVASYRHVLSESDDEVAAVCAAMAPDNSEV